MAADQSRTTMSPREAARLTGAGRSSIMRAIAAGHLSAQRDNRNQWQIARADLDRWQAARMDHDRTVTADRTGLDRTTLADHPETALALAAARATIAQLELRLTDHVTLIAAADDRTRAVEAERDRWRELADKLTDRLSERLAGPPSAPTSARRWWPWPRR